MHAEALTNVRRHAHATRVDITVAVEAGEIVLEIRDNGRGVTEDELAASKSLGLMGMRERAHFVGGRIEIKGVAQHGTVLTLRVPIPEEDYD
jgi:signal transduction histidine kinase